ncbi:MAG: amylo-alpha-1,6-glucosidase [Candidatus Dadabacteria bacterium]|nr:MAG: amylo-alpha-1,6-glucosidase [Candidatus Dadabacteria bacterium]
MTDIVPIGGEYYIPASSALADDRRRVLKHGDTFAVYDRWGDARPIGAREQGLYHAGTRYLSESVLRIYGERLLLLSSNVRTDNAVLRVDLTNPDLPHAPHGPIPGGAVHFSRTKFLWRGAAYERLQISNYAGCDVRFELSLEVGADFADVFEVRGTRRQRRGRYLEPRKGQHGIAFGYLGLDGVERWVAIRARPQPVRIEERTLVFDVALAAGARTYIEIVVVCEAGGEALNGGVLDVEEAEERLRSDMQHNAESMCRVETDNQQFDEWLSRSNSDLLMMLTVNGEGLYPYAGVPWYCTPFGRDGLITALECLWLDPDWMRGVLSFLAATQATELDPSRDAEPGKIVHEIRTGEMAATGEVPFGRYYGSVDATPLFVVAAARYFVHTGDRAFVEQLWPHVAAALNWMERYGDRDGDGFLEYQRESATGLANQGWKDSYDAVAHDDGTLAEGPIAVCEAQGYAYAALRGAAHVLRALGRDDRAGDLEARAQQLRARFDDAFWCDQIGTYALALDGHKRQCAVRSSNPGHCLYSGIVPTSKAPRVAAALMASDSFSGWGIRTLAAGQARYNPMSYHNGSVWPHDNAIAAEGLARYGFKREAGRIMAALYDASRFFELHRLPELFCGFTRRQDQAPTLYPVACSPQAWAAGAVFQLLGACLGIQVDGAKRRLRLERPFLPRILQEVRIYGLRVGDGEADFVVHRERHTVGVNVIRKTRGVEVVTVQ